METRSQEADRRALEAEKRAQEAEKKPNDRMGELGRRQEQLQKEAIDQRQEMNAKLEEMMQAIMAINIQNQANAGRAHPLVGVGGEEGLQGKNDYGKVTRFEFPKIDGEGFDGWIMGAEYFFEVAGTEKEERVRIAALHLDGKALLWHRGYISLQGDRAYEDWENYTRSLAARIGAHAFEDPLSDLRNLKKVSSLQVYMDSFDELYPRTSITEDHALSFFLSGLIDELQMPVRMFKPKCLADAYALAKLQELTVKAMQNNKSRTGQNSNSNAGGYSSGSRSLIVTTSNYRPSAPMGSGKGIVKNTNIARPGARLTSKEVEDRRSKGLCFWCDEKYTPNHHCPKRRAYVLQMVEEEDEEEAEGEKDNEMENEEVATDLQLSLHAMWGIEGNQIMRIRGWCQKKALRILVDTGSTHNFLRTQLVEKIGCETDQCEAGSSGSS